ncbi:hypothetical protein R1flu_029281 [Riccia fluitans]|uniref:Uncharacterized protein n=1 Tax=Riccia fluitans TaxID=41844 RepID=A0ABD1XT59_9MARC
MRFMISRWSGGRAKHSKLGHFLVISPSAVFFLMISLARLLRQFATFSSSTIRRIRLSCPFYDVCPGSWRCNCQHSKGNVPAAIATTKEIDAIRKQASKDCYGLKGLRLRLNTVKDNASSTEMVYLVLLSKLIRSPGSKIRPVPLVHVDGGSFLSCMRLNAVSRFCASLVCQALRFCRFATLYRSPDSYVTGASSSTSPRRLDVSARTLTVPPSAWHREASFHVFFAAFDVPVRAVFRRRPLALDRRFRPVSLLMFCFVVSV